jgi:voltage-gated potassium channel
MRSIRWIRRHVLFVIPLVGLVVLVAGGAAAALESDTIDSFWQGAWWALSLMMTVGFVGSEPLTTAGKVIAAVLMVTGFVLLATVTATIASIFVRQEEQPEERILQALENRVLAEVREVNERLRRLEERLDKRSGQENTPHRR